jgi:hypothetical protein
MHDLRSLFEPLGVADDHRQADRADLGIGDGHHRDLRSDTSTISHSDCDNGQGRRVSHLWFLSQDLA